MVDIGMDPELIVNGCLAPTYYSVLNVLDPSIAYDSSGKVVGVLRLPTDESNSEKSLNKYQNANEQRNPPENYDSHADSRSSRSSGKDIFQTPPKHGNYKLWVENYLANTDILKNLSLGSDTIEPTSEREQEKTLMQKQDPHPDVPEQYSANVPQMENQDKSKSPVPADGCMSNKEKQGPALELIEHCPKEEEKSTEHSTVEELIEHCPKEEEKSTEHSGVEEEIANPPSSWFAPQNQNPPSKSWFGIWKQVLEPTPKPEPPHQYESDVAPALEPMPEMNETKPTRELIENYGTNTPLFKTLERKNWHAVLFYLRTGSFSFSPLLGSTDMETVKQQVQTWVSKKDIVGNEMLRQLPLHGAICFGAPLKVIENLLKAYPAAVRRPDVHGNLPLHLAYIFNADDNTTAYLMRTFPESIHMVNGEGMQPIQCSAEVSSESFQSKSELFDALSDYTRAVAENAPEKLVEQLQDVRRQLKAVNDTLFSSAHVREPEAIKEHIGILEKPSLSLVALDPTAAFDGVGLSLCGVSLTEVKGIISPAHIPTNGMKPEPSKRDQPTEEKLQAEIPFAIPQAGCRVTEYCPATKTWREV